MASEQTQQGKPRTHSLSLISVSDLKFDDSNPNNLSEYEMEGLRASMRKFGYLTPIITDLNYLIADGEHRALVYKEFGMKEIPGFVLDLTDQDRRLIRQTMNKLRGTHDLTKDAQELSLLQARDLLPELSVLIAQDQKQLEKLISEYDFSLLEQQSKQGTRSKDNEQEEDSQVEIKEIDAPLQVEHTCPKCGYQW